VTGAEEIIVRLASLAGALTVISGALIAFVRFAVLRPLTRIVDDRVSQMEDSLGARLAVVEKEISYNGGATMRDAVRRIEQKIDAQNARHKAHEDRAAIHVRALSEALERQGLDIPDPKNYGFGPKE
jgi:Na+/H+ antiporter NhaB